MNHENGHKEAVITPGVYRLVNVKSGNSLSILPVPGSSTTQSNPQSLSVIAAATAGSPIPKITAETVRNRAGGIPTGTSKQTPPPPLPLLGTRPTEVVANGQFHQSWEIKSSVRDTKVGQSNHGYYYLTSNNLRMDLEAKPPATSKTNGTSGASEKSGTTAVVSGQATSSSSGTALPTGTNSSPLQPAPPSLPPRQVIGSAAGDVSSNWKFVRIQNGKDEEGNEAYVLINKEAKTVLGLDADNNAVVVAEIKTDMSQQWRLIKVDFGPEMGTYRIVSKLAKVALDFQQKKPSAVSTSIVTRTIGATNREQLWDLIPYADKNGMIWYTVTNHAFPNLTLNLPLDGLFGPRSDVRAGSTAILTPPSPNNVTNNNNTAKWRFVRVDNQPGSFMIINHVSESLLAAELPLPGHNPEDGVPVWADPWEILENAPDSLIWHVVKADYGPGQGVFQLVNGANSLDIAKDGAMDPSYLITAPTDIATTGSQLWVVHPRPSGEDGQIYYTLRNYRTNHRLEVVDSSLQKQQGPPDNNGNTDILDTMGNALQQADVRGVLSAAKDKTTANNKIGWRWRIVRDDEVASQYRFISCVDSVPAVVLGTEASTVQAKSDQGEPGQRWQLQLRVYKFINKKSNTALSLNSGTAHLGGRPLAARVNTRDDQTQLWLVDPVGSTPDDGVSLPKTYFLLRNYAWDHRAGLADDEASPAVVGVLPPPTPPNSSDPTPPPVPLAPSIEWFCVPDTDSDCFKLVDRAGGRVMDLLFGTDAGAGVVARLDDGSSSQRWRAVKVNDFGPEPGLYRIVNNHANTSITVTNETDGNSTRLTAGASSQDLKQAWLITPTTDGFFHVFNPDSQLELNLAPGTADGTKIVGYKSPDVAGSHWRFSREPTLGSNCYKIRDRAAPNLLVDLTDGSSAVGTDLHGWEDEAREWQVWRLEKFDRQGPPVKGIYQIVNFYLGACLSLADRHTGSKLIGAALSINNADQQWILDPTNGDSSINNFHVFATGSDENDKLEMYLQSGDVGSQPVARQVSSSTSENATSDDINALWSFEESDGVEGPTGTFRIRCKGFPNGIVDMPSTTAATTGSNDSDDAVQAMTLSPVWAPNTTSITQWWFLQRVDRPIWDRGPALLPADPDNENVPDGVYRIINRHGDHQRPDLTLSLSKVVVEEGNTRPKSKTAVVGRKIVPEAHEQFWYISRDRSAGVPGGAYIIRNYAMPRLLDLADPLALQVYAGVAVWAWPPPPAGVDVPDTARWFLRREAGGLGYSLVSAATGSLLDLEDGGVAASHVAGETKALARPKIGLLPKYSQKWALVSVDTPGPVQGIYRITNRYTRTNLTMARGATEGSDLTGAEQSTEDPATQNWLVEPTSDGLHRLRSISAGLTASMDGPAPIITTTSGDNGYPCVGREREHPQRSRWRFRPDSDTPGTYIIENVAWGLCLDLWQGWADDDTPVRGAPYSAFGGPKIPWQRWKLERLDTPARAYDDVASDKIESGVYRIDNVGTGYSLSLPASTTVVGTPIQVTRTPSSTTNPKTPADTTQYWIVSATFDSLYAIQHQLSPLCVSLGAIAPGSLGYGQVCTYPDGVDSTRFKFIKSDGGAYRIVCNETGTLLEHMVDKKDTTGVVQGAQDSGGRDEQRWQLVRVDKTTVAYLPRGTYEITNKSTGTSLGIVGTDSAVTSYPIPSSQDAETESATQQQQQIWLLEPAPGGDHQSYGVIHPSTHLALGTANNLVSGTVIAAGTAPPEWKIVASPDSDKGEFFISQEPSGMRLDLASDGSTAVRIAAVATESSAIARQIWKISKVDLRAREINPAKGLYYISNALTGTYLAAPAVSQPDEVGVNASGPRNVDPYSLDALQQVWLFEPDSDGWFVIKSMARGLRLGADLGGPNGVARVVTDSRFNALGLPGYQWRFVRDASGASYCRLINRLAVQTLRLDSASTVQIGIDTGALAQRWILERLSGQSIGTLIPRGVYTIEISSATTTDATAAKMNIEAAQNSATAASNSAMTIMDAINANIENTIPAATGNVATIVDRLSPVTTGVAASASSIANIADRIVGNVLAATKTIKSNDAATTSNTSMPAATPTLPPSAETVQAAIDSIKQSIVQCVITNGQNKTPGTTDPTSETTATAVLQASNAIAPLPSIAVADLTALTNRIADSIVEGVSGAILTLAMDSTNGGPPPDNPCTFLNLTGTRLSARSKRNQNPEQAFRITHQHDGLYRISNLLTSAALAPPSSKGSVLVAPSTQGTGDEVLWHIYRESDGSFTFQSGSTVLELPQLNMPDSDLGVEVKTADASPDDMKKQRWKLTRMGHYFHNQGTPGVPGVMTVDPSSGNLVLAPWRPLANNALQIWHMWLMDGKYAFLSENDGRILRNDNGIKVADNSNTDINVKWSIAKESDNRLWFMSSSSNRFLGLNNNGIDVQEIDAGSAPTPPAKRPPIKTWNLVSVNQVDNLTMMMAPRIALVSQFNRSLVLSVKPNQPTEPLFVEHYRPDGQEQRFRLFRFGMGLLLVNELTRRAVVRDLNSGAVTSADIASTDFNSWWTLADNENSTFKDFKYFSPTLNNPNGLQLALPMDSTPGSNVQLVAGNGSDRAWKLEDNTGDLPDQDTMFRIQIGGADTTDSDPLVVSLDPAKENDGQLVLRRLDLADERQMWMCPDWGQGRWIVNKKNGYVMTQDKQNMPVDGAGVFPQPPTDVGPGATWNSGDIDTGDGFFALQSCVARAVGTDLANSVFNLQPSGVAQHGTPLVVGGWSNGGQHEVWRFIKVSTAGALTDRRATLDNFINSNAPNFYLHPNDAFDPPASVEWYLGRALLSRDNDAITTPASLTTLPPTEPGALLERDRNRWAIKVAELRGLKSGDFRDATVYVQVRPAWSSIYYGYTDLRFWLFYPTSTATNGMDGTGWRFVTLRFNNTTKSLESVLFPGELPVTTSWKPNRYVTDPTSGKSVNILPMEKSRLKIFVPRDTRQARSSLPAAPPSTVPTAPPSTVPATPPPPPTDPNLSDTGLVIKSSTRYVILDAPQTRDDEKNGRPIPPQWLAFGSSWIAGVDGAAGGWGPRASRNWAGDSDFTV